MVSLGQGFKSRCRLNVVSHLTFLPLSNEATTDPNVLLTPPCPVTQVGLLTLLTQEKLKKK